MPTVRKYKAEDKEAVRKICTETCAFNLSDEKSEKFLYLMYNDYYTEVEPDVAFCALDENGEVIGYILCAKNFKGYLKTFKKIYLPKINSIGLSYALRAAGEIFSHALLCGKYKAHLHIDITERCRRSGAGTALMNALKAELLKNDIHSLSLSCASSNKAAVEFYKKNDFKILFKAFGSNVMVCDF